jgi:hypothetical protein
MEFEDCQDEKRIVIHDKRPDSDLVLTVERDVHPQKKSVMLIFSGVGPGPRNRPIRGTVNSRVSR